MSEETHPCGTLAASRRHHRHGEPLDDACLAAQKAHRKVMYQQEVAAGRLPVKAAKRAAKRAAISYLIESHFMEFELTYHDFLSDELEKRGVLA